ncbi:hypothetical protein LGM35_02805 [Burkholderia cenocepacia]|uniref:hypothetical protein n=1 Tax=Burkholderia cenocepacia TaxID=95486 RepID=UPI001CF423D3|nr:hypothetical protein [Burkholderia cenocepacia]MCA7921400.1 hypothetical protein [Burkholderia cenocepacia]
MSFPTVEPPILARFAHRRKRPRAAMLALFPVIPRRPMIAIRAARYPDDAAAVEGVFREYVVSPTVSLALADDGPEIPAPGAEFPERNP